MREWILLASLAMVAAIATGCSQSSDTADLNAELNRLRTEQAALKAEHATELAKLRDRIDAVERGGQTELLKLTEWAGTIPAILKSVEQFQTFADSFGDISALMKQLNGVTTLAADLNQMNEKFASLETGIKGVEQYFGEGGILQQLEGLGKDQERVDVQLQDVSNQILSVTQSLEAINKLLPFMKR